MGRANAANLSRGSHPPRPGQSRAKKGLQVTDDTAACELIGQPVRLVLGTEPNPKVTVPDDVP